MTIKASNFSTFNSVSQLLNYTTIVYIIWSLVACGKTVLGDNSFEEIRYNGTSPFLMIIDGGSTGSRLHLFEFTVNSSASLDCVRRGSWKAYTPLSSFGRLPSEIKSGVPLIPSKISNHLVPLFEHAASIIPSEHYSSTGVYYQATAGMRLLDETEQNAVYDALYDGLMGSTFEKLGIRFPFKNFKRDGIATLNGEKEGFFGAVAANFLSGAVDAYLNFKNDKTDNDDETETLPLGALDMGGASAQIVFLPPKGTCLANYGTSSSVDEHTCQTKPSNPDRLDIDDLFSVSHLSYGVDPIREKLWEKWIENHTNSSNEIENPCAFRGHLTEWKGYLFLGTGQSAECSLHVQRLIPSLDHSESLPEKEKEIENNLRKVNGIEHPPVRGKFYAMSNFFFSLDSLRVLSQPGTDAHITLNEVWPNPTLEELDNALDGFCSREWEGDLEDIKHDAHKYTQADKLPYRCLESVYIVNLLRHGFGFDPNARDITFTYDIDGSEIEWTLGMALWLNAQTSMSAFKSVFSEPEQKSILNDINGNSCRMDYRDTRNGSQMSST